MHERVVGHDIRPQQPRVREYRGGKARGEGRGALQSPCEAELEPPAAARAPETAACARFHAGGRNLGLGGALTSRSYERHAGRSPPLGVNPLTAQPLRVACFQDGRAPTDAAGGQPTTSGRGGGLQIDGAVLAPAYAATSRA